VSYHITILRTKKGKRYSIDGVEFAAAARGFPELRFDSAAGKADYFRAGELRASLFLQEGEIWTQVAEPDVIEVMIRLANVLEARVRGDEFETYRSVDDTYTHPDDEKERDEAEDAGTALVRASRRQQWIFNLCIFGSFGILAMIVGYCSRR
jgi:hypothetical protein